MSNMPIGRIEQLTHEPVRTYVDSVTKYVAPPVQPTPSLTDKDAEIARLRAELQHEAGMHDSMRRQCNEAWAHAARLRALLERLNDALKLDRHDTGDWPADSLAAVQAIRAEIADKTLAVTPPKRQDSGDSGRCDG